MSICIYIYYSSKFKNFLRTLNAQQFYENLMNLLALDENVGVLYFGIRTLDWVFTTTQLTVMY